MNLQFKSDYLSIKQFEPIKIENLTVLTGLNGSGKTHFLKAIAEGNITIDNLERSEIIYYNYNDFTINSNKIGEDPSYNQKTINWNIYKSDFINKVNQLKQSVIDEFHTTLASTIDSALLNYVSNPNIDRMFNNAADENAFEDLKSKDLDRANLFNSYNSRFTPPFFFFFEHLLYSNIEVKDFEFKFFKPRINELKGLVSDSMKEKDPALYDYLIINNKNPLTVDYNDFDSPIFFLEDIANEEKNYQVQYAQNILNKMNATEYGAQTDFYEKNDFLEHFGSSPIVQINEVLKEYDCNGYRLISDQYQAQLGQDISSLSLNIRLQHAEAGYLTTFDQLSSGEKTLIALSLLIFKSKRKIMPSVLLLDEIDSALHPSMIQRLLNVIQNIFIKKHSFKVILATHSPTTVALSPSSSIFIINKTGNNKIIQKDKSEAINILTEGFAVLSPEDNRLSISYNLEHNDLPVLFTEGITDKIIIETAWNKLFPNKKQPFYIQDCFDAAFMSNLLKRGDDPQDGFFVNYPNRLFIALFDFDEKGYNAWNSTNNIHNEAETDPKKCLCRGNDKGNGYILLLPVPENEKVSKQVIKKGSDTYKHQSILTIELMLYGAPELDKNFINSSVMGGGEIIKFNNDKRKFARSLTKVPAERFNSFFPLFNKISELICVFNLENHNI